MYNKALYVWFLGKLARSVFPRVLHDITHDLVSRNIGTLGTTKPTVSLGSIHQLHSVALSIDSISNRKTCLQSYRVSG